MSADKYPSIFSKSNGGYGVYYHSNIFDITRNLKKNWGKYKQSPPFGAKYICSWT